MSSTLAVTSSQSIAWIGAQLAAAKTSQYGVVRVLASCCSVKGFAIATLLTFAGTCFYKARQNHIAFAAVYIPETRPEVKAGDLRTHADGSPVVDGGNNRLEYTQDQADVMNVSIRLSNRPAQNAQDTCASHLRWKYAQIVAGTAALVAVAVVAVFVPV